MGSTLESHITKIEGLRELHLTICSEMLKADNGKMFALDILASAVIKRSMSLCFGFSRLMRDKNYTCAAALLRLQLDSCLRFFAAFIVEHPHEFATKVLEGEPIKNLKDTKGCRMTDRYLVDLLGKKYEWMPRVYDATSGFIHLSERHIFTVWQPSAEENTLSIRIGESDDDISEELWIEMAEGFLACTDALFEYLKGWVFTKINPELVKKLAAKRKI